MVNIDWQPTKKGEMPLYRQIFFPEPLSDRTSEK